MAGTMSPRRLLPVAAAWAACLAAPSAAVELMRSEGGPVSVNPLPRATVVDDRRRRRSFGFCENNGKDCTKHEGCDCRGLAPAPAALADVSEHDVRAALLQRRTANGDEEDGGQPADGGLDGTVCRKEDRFHCKKVAVEDVTARVTGTGKLAAPQGRCFHDLLQKCTSKWECNGGKHACLWSDAEIDGGHCKESKQACRGRWECPREKRIGNAAEDYEDCIGPNRCEHDHSTMCEKDEDCGHNIRCMARCKFSAWPTRFDVRCTDKPCYWDDSMQNEFMTFERRTSDVKSCTPLCEENQVVVAGVEHAKITCMRRPFVHCFSKLTSSICAYGEGYNGVDEDVGVDERCTCTLVDVNTTASNLTASAAKK